MLEAITWNHYFSALAIGLILYYLGIAIFYYPKELRSLISGNSKLFNPTPQQEKDRHLSRTENNRMDPYEELEITVAELKGILEKAGTTTAVSRLFLNIRQILSNHPGLREPAFRVAIINFLFEHIPKINRLDIQESDLEAIWES